jgi:ATP-dependent RNA helicase DDX3X
LVNILLETGQAVPDFLDSFKPESGIAEFEDDLTDDEDETSDYVAAPGPDAFANAPAADAWGSAPAGDAFAKAPVAADAWGAAAAANVSW